MCGGGTEPIFSACGSPHSAYATFRASSGPSAVTTHRATWALPYEDVLGLYLCRALSKKYGKVRLAVIYDNPDRQGKPIYCFTRMLTWNAQKIVQVRCHRWDIEPLHEQIKQFLGAEDSQLQTEAGVRRHLTLVFVVNSLLKSLDLSQPIGDLPMAEFQNVSPTFGQRCRRILL
jgi:Archaeal putative transposase ISC1217